MTDDTRYRYCPECFRRFSGEEEVCPDHEARLIRLPVEETLVGQEVDGKYLIEGKLGQGGMGTVYKARQRLINRTVALKVLRGDFARDVNAVKRFFGEAQAASQLRCRHSVILYDFGLSDDGLLYFTMEFLDGDPLSRILRRRGRLEAPEAMHITRDVCESLDEAHSLGIVHRDLKPDNLMIVEDREQEIAKVLDFGIAKLLTRADGTSLTSTGMVCGTPEYMSPEQAGGKPLGPNSDIYSLGVVLYEMLAGVPPFRENTPVLVLMKHINEEPVPVSTVRPDIVIPSGLNDLLGRMLSKDPAKRPAGARALQAELEKFLADEKFGRRKVRISGMRQTADGLRQITTDGLVDTVTPAEIAETGARLDGSRTEAGPAVVDSAADTMPTPEATQSARRPRPDEARMAGPSGIEREATEPLAEEADEPTEPLVQEEEGAMPSGVSPSETMEADGPDLTGLTERTTEEPRIPDSGHTLQLGRKRLHQKGWLWVSLLLLVAVAVASAYLGSRFLQMTPDKEEQPVARTSSAPALPVMNDRMVREDLPTQPAQDTSPPSAVGAPDVLPEPAEEVPGAPILEVGKEVEKQVVEGIPVRAQPQLTPATSPPSPATEKQEARPSAPDAQIGIADLASPSDSLPGGTAAVPEDEKVGERPDAPKKSETAKAPGNPQKAHSADGLKKGKKHDSRDSVIRQEKSSRKLMEEAKKAKKDGDYDGAIDKLKKALEKSGSDRKLRKKIDAQIRECEQLKVRKDHKPSVPFGPKDIFGKPTPEKPPHNKLDDKVKEKKEKRVPGDSGRVEFDAEELRLDKTGKKGEDKERKSGVDSEE